MGQGYFRNTDDSISDPELIAGRYRIGRSAFYEVQLTLAEFSDTNVSASGGINGSPTFIEAVGLESPFIGCPSMDEFIWIKVNDKPNSKPLPVKVSELWERYQAQKKIEVFNPLSNNYNRLIFAEVLTQPLVMLETSFGIKNLVSASHKIIKNTADINGTPLAQHTAEAEIVTWNSSCYQDVVKSKTNRPNGEVLRISLDAEFIYLSGHNQDAGILAHNRKRETE